VKTFYIASHSKNIDAVRRLAFLLESFGYEWYDDFDWTLVANDDLRDESQVALNLAADIQGASKAGLFVYLDNSELDYSRGAHIEIGIRIGLGKTVFAIWDDGSEKDYFFYRSGLVRSITEEELLNGLVR